MSTLYSLLKSNNFLIAGPCVIEGYGLLEEIAEFLVEIRKQFDIPVIFKSSFDKANRTSLGSYRGPGLERGIGMLGDIKERYDLPLLTDVHEPHQAAPVSEVVDVLQIPAFLCRQTDLLVSAANTGAIVNIKKAQFLSGKDMIHAVNKVKQSGNEQILLTERGSMYGYNNLVVDYRNIVDMVEYGYPVVFDATHSVQRPGGEGGKSSGNREYVKPLSLAAKGAGCNGYFFEIHPNPDKALSDGPNMITPMALKNLLKPLIS